MSQSQLTLEQQRSAILTGMLESGDFRSGSVTTITGPCGKASCHCHQPASRVVVPTTG